MALIFWEGFDSYSSISQLLASRTELNGTFGSDFSQNPDFYTSSGRFGGGAISRPLYSGPGLINFTATANPTELYTGRAAYVGNGTADGDGILQVYNNSFPSRTGDVYLTCGSGYIYAYNFNGTLLGTSPASTIISATWFWVELRVKMSTDNATADGIVQVWINNRQVISNTACITKRTNAATGYGGVNIMPFNYNGGNFIDDIYVLDTTGSAPWNTRLGDCRIASIAVNSDSGPNDFAVSSGNTNHYTVVDEIPYSASDWLSTSSLNSNFGEMFRIAGLPSSNAFSVLAGAVVAVGGKTDAGNAAFKISIRSAGTRANSNTQYLSTSNTFYRQEWVTNPNTSAQWTTGEWANANVGIYVV